MVREELLAGLKNAVDRGYSLQSAIQSFINAGYNAEEVQETAKQINMGVIGQISEQKKDTSLVNTQSISNKNDNWGMELPSPPTQIGNDKQVMSDKPVVNYNGLNNPINNNNSNNVNNFQSLPVQDMIIKPQTKKRFPTFLIILIILFLLLVLGAAFFYFFGEDILNAMFSK